MLIVFVKGADGCVAFKKGYATSEEGISFPDRSFCNDYWNYSVVVKRQEFSVVYCFEQ